MKLAALLLYTLFIIILFARNRLIRYKTLRNSIVIMQRKLYSRMLFHRQWRHIHSVSLLCFTIHSERYTLLQLHCQPSYQQRPRMLSQQQTLGQMPTTGGYVFTGWIHWYITTLFWWNLKFSPVVYILKWQYVFDMSSIKSAESAHLMLTNLIFKHLPIFNQ